MMRQPHLDDETVTAVADGDPVAEDRGAAHLAACEPCRGRVRDEIAARTYVARAADLDVVPPNDVAGRAIALIRARDAAVASLNETVGSLGDVGRSLVHFVFGRRA